MGKLEIEVGQEYLDCLDWLADRQQSTREHIVRAILINGLHLAGDHLRGQDDFQLMVDAATLEFKRWCRAEAPEIWAKLRGER